MTEAGNELSSNGRAFKWQRQRAGLQRRVTEDGAEVRGQRSEDG